MQSADQRCAADKVCNPNRRTSEKKHHKVNGKGKTKYEKENHKGDRRRIYHQIIQCLQHGEPTSGIRFTFSKACGIMRLQLRGKLGERQLRMRECKIPYTLIT